MVRIVNNPHWTLFAENGVLLLSGGADELYVVDEASSAGCIEQLLAAWKDDMVGTLLQDPVCGAAARQLQRMGVLVPATAAQSVQCLALSWLGNPLPELVAAMQRLSGSAGAALCGKPEDADLLVLIRSNASWQESLRLYRENAPQQPHLLIDLACHHTLSVGPYVVPGDSACIACLGHRITHRWGDMPLPLLPQASVQYELIAALILQAAGVEPLPYLERVASLDLRNLDSRSERVFRLPKCEVCQGSNVLDAEGFLPLPWAN